jgi:diphthamide biosynthesis enzyme Dph1/Dph2-like protein
MESDYDLELERAVSEIKKLSCKRSAQSPAKLVCIQLPDGLKPLATGIANELEKKTSAKILIWLGSCFGACDVPDLKEVDLLIQWGHSKWVS